MFGCLLDLLLHLVYNISNLSLNRERRYGDVITVIETDAPLDHDTVEELRAVNSVENVVVIPKF